MCGTRWGSRCSQVDAGWSESGSRTGAQLRGVVGRAAAIAAVAGSLWVTLGCTRDGSSASSPAPGTSASLGQGAGPGSGAVGAGEGSGSAPGVGAVPSDLAAKAPGSPDVQRCVQVRLEADPALASALGADPSASPRAEDFGRLVTACGQASLADRFATGVAASVAGGLSEAQLTCLRDGYAALSPEALGSIVQAGLNPDSAVPASPTAPSPMNELWSRCGVDPSNVKVGF